MLSKISLDVITDHMEVGNATYNSLYNLLENV